MSSAAASAPFGLRTACCRSRPASWRHLAELLTNLVEYVLAADVLEVGRIEQVADHAQYFPAGRASPTGFAMPRETLPRAGNVDERARGLGKGADRQQQVRRLSSGSDANGVSATTKFCADTFAAASATAVMSASGSDVHQQQPHRATVRAFRPRSKPHAPIEPPHPACDAAKRLPDSRPAELGPFGERTQFRAGRIGNRRGQRSDRGRRAMPSGDVAEQHQCVIRFLQRLAIFFCSSPASTPSQRPLTDFGSSLPHAATAMPCQHLDEARSAETLAWHVEEVLVLGTVREADVRRRPGPPLRIRCPRIGASRRIFAAGNHENRILRLDVRNVAAEPREHRVVVLDRKSRRRRRWSMLDVPR